MMEEATLQVFKMKFIKLTVLLNIIVLLVALAAVAAFKFHNVFGTSPSYDLPAAFGFLLAAAVLALYFRSQYAREKAWLDEHADEPKKDAGGGNDTT
jgi:protein-S-isoprenylcysteine O-methyltransferase Ste14